HDALPIYFLVQEISTCRQDQHSQRQQKRCSSQVILRDFRQDTESTRDSQNRFHGTVPLKKMTPPCTCKSGATNQYNTSLIRSVLFDQRILLNVTKVNREQFISVRGRATTIPRGDQEPSVAITVV